MKKRVIATITNNIVTDQRLQKVCNSLIQHGFEVKLIGSTLGGKPELNFEFDTYRIPLIFKKGALFYAEFNLKLFFYLIFKQKKNAILLANDLDTLLPVFLNAKIFDNKLIFDSHEIFSELPSIEGRSVKKVWKFLEKWLLPKVKNFYTVSEGYANWFKNQYGVNPKIIRNVPYKNENFVQENIENDSKILIYQGAINGSRGIDKMILAMNYLENCQLWIVGNGPKLAEYQQLTESQNLTEKVQFFGRISPEDLKKITPQADLGLSLEEANGLSYKLALPNKSFDYMHAGVPILATGELPELENIVEKYQIGKVINTRIPEEIAQEINSILEIPKSNFSENLKKAAVEFNWQNQEKLLISIFENAI